MADLDFKKLTDEEIVAEAQKGNNSAYEYLIEKYRGTAKLKARKYYIIGGEIEDVVQEGTIGIFKAIRDYKPEGGASFSSFLHLCVERQIMTAVTKANRDKHKALNQSISLNVNGEEQRSDEESGQGGMIASEESLGLGTHRQAGRDPGEIAVEREEFLDLLNISEVILTDLENKVWLAMLEGKNYREIAEEMGRSPKTIDNAMQRVKKKMRNHLSIVDIPVE